MERLQKVIANSGFCSRRKAEELISQGKVKVNNQIVTEQGIKVSNDDRIEINGTLLPLKEEKEYYLLYKPEKTISSVKDEKGRKTVTELIPSKGRIYPVGRLDYDTTGVLLLTNDGELTNILTHPKNKIEKFYRAKVTGVVTREEIMKIKKGIEMTSTQFKNILSKYGVVEIEALGYPFDPNYMEAMMVAKDVAMAV